MEVAVSFHPQICPGGPEWGAQGRGRSDRYRSDSEVGRTHMELGSQSGLTLVLIQQILLGTCRVPSIVLISGKQAKGVWFFPRGWWGKTKQARSPVCLISKSVCVHVRVRACVCIHFCRASWPLPCCALSGCGICWLSVSSVSVSDVIQPGLHTEHETWSREPQESGRTLRGLCHCREGEADVASPGRYSQFIIVLNSGSTWRGQGADDVSTAQKCPFCFPFIAAVLNYSAFLNKWN